MPADNHDKPDLSYPRLEATAPAVVTRPYKQQTWCGSKERLIAVQELLQSVLKDAYDRALGDLDLSQPDDYTTRRQLERLREAHRLSVTVRGRDEKWTQNGELSAIFATVDLDEIEAVTMSSGNSFLGGESAKVAVTLRDLRSAWRPCVEVEVSGTDPTWVTGVKDQLATALVKDRPWWSVLRRPWVALAIGWVLSVAAVLSYVLIFGVGTEAPDLALYFLFTLVVSVGLNFASTKLLERLLPGFEVVPVGGRSLGGLRLALLGGFSAFVLANVILPIVLSLKLD